MIDGDYVLILQKHPLACEKHIFQLNFREDSDIADFGYWQNSDTGERFDMADFHAEICGRVNFVRKIFTKSFLPGMILLDEIKKKYNITDKDFDEICTKLENELRFKKCSICD